MSTYTVGPSDVNVLNQLRRFGLHPAVRVFETRLSESWAEMSLKRLITRSAEHRPTLRLVIGTRTA